MKGRGREGVGSVAVETERRRREAPCRRCGDAVGGSLPYFYPCTRSFFSSSSGSRAASPHFATSKIKVCWGQRGARRGDASPAVRTHTGIKRVAMQEQPELWWREEDACVLSRAGVAYCRCGRRRQTRVSAATATATGSWRFLYFPCQTFSLVV